MFRTVAREHHWPPQILGGLYLDRVDHLGLEFWVDDVIKVNEEIKQLIKDKK